MVSPAGGLGRSEGFSGPGGAGLLQHRLSWRQAGRVYWGTARHLPRQARRGAGQGL